MSLVPSLLQAIVRVDGEALVMHVGEKPYVVSPHGQIDLATRGLTFEAVNGLVAQLLPADAMRSLEDVGATQFQLPPFAEFPGEQFVVTAARGGDDVWAEIRRHPAPEEDIVGADLFAAFNPPVVEPAPAPEDLVLPREAQLWPPSPSPYPQAQVPVAGDESSMVVPEPVIDHVDRVERVVEPPAMVAPPVALVPATPPVVEPAVPVTAPAPVEPLPVAAAETVTDPAPAPAAPIVAQASVAAAAEPAESPVQAEPSSTTADVAPTAADVDENDSQRKIASWLAAFSPQHLFARPEPPVLPELPAIVADVAPPVFAVAPLPVAEAPSVPLVTATTPDPVVPVAAVAEPIADVPAASDGPVGQAVPTVPAAPVTPVAPGTPVVPVLPAVPELPAVPVPPDVAVVPVLSVVPVASVAPVAAEPPLEPAIPAAVPARFETLAEPIVSTPILAGRAESKSEAVMSTQSPQSPEFRPFVPTPAAPPAAAEFPPASSPRPASFVPFPSLVDQPQAAVVLPMARGGREGSGENAAALERLLRQAASRGASALYLSTGARPSVRLDGDVQTLDSGAVLSATDIEQMLAAAVPEHAADAVRGGAGEWSWELSDVGSVRCTTFRDHRGPGAVFRIVVVRPQSASQLGLSREIQSLASETEGLVLVSGPRASGKSTLISSFVDLINRTRRDFVVTIESEVTVVHDRQGAFISQREARGGSDEAAAMARAALREDPDVLVIDDLRTSALMSVALDAAANGQLVIGGVPAHHASGAIERLIDLYQPEHRRQVQLAMAQNLRGVVSQVLLRKTGGGRVAAREVLLNTSMVSGLLAEGRLPQLPMAIEGGRKSGMVPLNDALVGFVQSGAVDVREAYRRAVDRPGLLDLLKRQGIDTSFVERLA